MTKVHEVARYIRKYIMTLGVKNTGNEKRNKSSRTSVVTPLKNIKL